MKFFTSLVAAIVLVAGSLSAQQALPNTQPVPLSLPLSSGNTIQGLAGTATAVTYTIFGLEISNNQTVYKVLAQGQLGTSNSTLYTVGFQTTAFVTGINLANATSSAVSTVTLAINGSAATAGNQILPGISIPANGLATFAEGSWKIHDSSGNIYQTGTAAFDSTIAAVTTPLALGTAGTATTSAHRDHTHQSPGGCASIVAASSAIVNAEASVVSCTVPATLLAAGTTFRVTASGTITTAGSPGNDVFRVRVGPTTLTGNIAGTVTAAATASITAQPFYLDFLVTVRTAGASGTVVGQGIVQSTNVTTGAFNALNVVGITSTAVAVDTTVANLVQLTAVTGAADSSVTFQNASIEIVKM